MDPFGGMQCMAGEEDPGRLTSKGRATRARIVEAAAGLMSRQGVAGTSIDDVRKATGMRGSQMTHYFRDKRSLVRAVIAWQADAVIGLHRHPALGELDTFEALERWAELNVAHQRELHCEGGCGLGSLAGELAGPSRWPWRDCVSGTCPSAPSAAGRTPSCSTQSWPRRPSTGEPNRTCWRRLPTGRPTTSGSTPCTRRSPTSPPPRAGRASQSAKHARTSTSASATRLPAEYLRSLPRAGEDRSALRLS